MPFRGTALVMAACLSAIAAGGRVLAQSESPEVRMIQAFSRYCVETAAEPALVRRAVEEAATLVPRGTARFPNGGLYESAEILDSVARIDPHERILIRYGKGLDGDGRERFCGVDVAWGQKHRIIAELHAKLAIADGTSTVEKASNGRDEVDITRWTTRVGNSEAVVELRMLTYAAPPGRYLELTVKEQ
jgi:hypothetical protein